MAKHSRDEFPMYVNGFVDDGHDLVQAFERAVDAGLEQGQIWNKQIRMFIGTVATPKAFNSVQAVKGVSLGQDPGNIM